MASPQPRRWIGRGQTLRWLRLPLPGRCLPALGTWAFLFLCIHRLAWASLHHKLSVDSGVSHVCADPPHLAQSWRVSRRTKWLSSRLARPAALGGVQRAQPPELHRVDSTRRPHRQRRLRNPTYPTGPGNPTRGRSLETPSPVRGPVTPTRRAEAPPAHPGLDSSRRVPLPRLTSSRWLWPWRSWPCLSRGSGRGALRATGPYGYGGGDPLERALPG